MFKKIASLLCALALCLALAPVDAHVGDIPEDTAEIVVPDSSHGAGETESPDRHGVVNVMESEEVPDEPGDGGQ